MLSGGATGGEDVVLVRVGPDPIGHGEVTVSNAAGRVSSYVGSTRDGSNGSHGAPIRSRRTSTHAVIPGWRNARRYAIVAGTVRYVAERPVSIPDARAR